MYAKAFTPVDMSVMFFRLQQKAPAMSLNLVQFAVLTDRRHQYQDLCNCRNARRLLVFRTQCAGHVRASLPEGSHDDNPAKAIAVDERLGKMRDCESAEEDGEDYSDGEVGRVLPKGVAGFGGDVAMRGGSCV